MERIKNLSEKFAQRYITECSSIYFTKVLCGKASGVVWGENEENSEFLLVWSDYQKEFQLMGQPLEEEKWDDFYLWFVTTAMSFLVENEMEFCEYGGDSEELLDMMSAVLYDWKIDSEKQKIFAHNGTECQVDRPEGFEYCEIDRDFLNSTYENKEYIINEINASYGSIDAYLTEGYGYAAVQSGKIVARAIMTFGDDRGDNLSVDTMESDRRQGLAQYLVSLLVKKANTMKHKVIWDCSEDNVASEKTALKNGFWKVREDVICNFSIVR